MFEYFAAWLPWKIDVKNDDIRARLVETAGLVEKLNGLLAVPHNMEVDRKVGPFDGSSDEIHIRLVVLRDEDLPAAERRRFFRPGG
jgi:hypothetical protein